MSDSPLITFLEAQLGLLQGGVAVPEAGFQVVRFADTPEPGVSAFCSLGLSNHRLAQSDGRSIRQEVLFACREAGPWHPESLVADVGEEVIAGHRAIQRGQLVGPRGPFFDGSTCEAVLALSPTAWPDALQVWRGSDPETVIVWLVPLTGAEAAYAIERGWNQLERLLVDRQPDPFDLRRESSVGEQSV